MKITPLKIITGMCFGSAFSLQALAAAPSSISADQQVQGFWLTEDSAAIVEVVPCEAGSDLLCGFVRALPGAAQNPELAKHADELCGAPLLSNLTYNERKARWDDGRLFDPESEQLFDAFIRIEDHTLLVRAYEGHEMFGETLSWTAAKITGAACETAPHGGGA